MNDLIEYNNMLRNVKNIKIEKFKLNKLINELTYVYEPIFKHKKIKLINSIKNSNLTIETDRDKLLQILNNIIGNSAKFTEKGYIKISIYNVNKQILEIQIEDTGIGMSE